MAFALSARLPVEMYWRLPLKSAKAERLLVEHAQEAGRAAAMLNIRLAVGIDRREIE